MQNLMKNHDFFTKKHEKNVKKHEKKWYFWRKKGIKKNDQKLDQNCQISKTSKNDPHKIEKNVEAACFWKKGQKNTLFWYSFIGGNPGFLKEIVIFRKNRLFQAHFQRNFRGLESRINLKVSALAEEKTRIFGLLKKVKFPKIWKRGYFWGIKRELKNDEKSTKNEEKNIKFKKKK